MNAYISRRSLLKAGAFAAAGSATIGLASCSPKKIEEQELPDKTGSNPDWLGEEPETPSSYAAEYNADVVVCGLGIAGVSALRAAVEAGASAIGFDKGDATRSSNEMCAYGSPLYASRFPDVAKFWENSDALILNAVSEGCLYRNDTRILRHWMDINGEATDWYFSALDESDYECGTAENENRVSPEAELAVTEPIYPIPAHYNPFEENMPCIPGTFRMGGKKKGSGFLAANLTRAAELGAAYYTYTPAVKLISDADGKIVGVIAKNENGEYVKANASKGVVLATGDFMNNREMLREFLPAVLDQGYEPNGPENYYTTLDSEGNPCNVGDGHKMAAWVGGKMQDFGATMSHFSKSSNSSVFGTLPYLMLDKNGRRFMNEDVQGQQFAERIRQLPDRQAVLFFDSAFTEQMPWMPYGHGKLPNTTQKDVDEYVEQGMLYKADTLEDLLSNFDIDAETALKSIQRYNELAEAGIDLDFGKTPTRMFALKNPPYYANRMTRGDDLVTMAGIVSDENCRAYDSEHRIIPGLYLAGNVQGNRFACIYPEIFMGYSVAMAMAYGREAGINAASA